MIKTKIKKAVVITALAAISATTLGWVYASTIGQATVTGNSGLNQNIIWDDTLPGTATWVVSGIKVTASVSPALNMSISADEIALWELTPWTESTWNLNIEVGTNATTWIQITARSGNGGLNNTNDWNIQINNLNTDGNIESYKFTSSHTEDSTVTGFTSTGDLPVLEINENTTEHQIYLTNKPEITSGSNDVTFTVATTANAQTIAGDYEDDITFTVVGNF
jgi:hypothetical protein